MAVRVNKEKIATPLFDELNKVYLGRRHQDIILFCLQEYFAAGGKPLAFSRPCAFYSDRTNVKGPSWAENPEDLKCVRVTDEWVSSIVGCNAGSNSARTKPELHCRSKRTVKLYEGRRCISSGVKDYFAKYPARYANMFFKSLSDAQRETVLAAGGQAFRKMVDEAVSLQSPLKPLPKELSL